LVPSDNCFDPNDYMRLQGARQLGGLGQQALRELFILRDQLAKESDLPPFKVLHNETLMILAESVAKPPREVRELAGLSPRQAQRCGQRIVEALERARALGPIERPPQLRSKDGTGELDDTEYELHERLKEWRRQQAAREGFDASLVLNRHVLLRLAKEKPRTMDELERVEGLLDWQRSEMGPALAQLIDRSLRDFQSAPPHSRRRNHHRN
jgi:ribonuclease D